MAMLMGYAIAIGGTGADHTYVQSDDGHVWPCWGRSSGGHEICSGRGSSAQANCLSQSDSHAGILYAISGVCHQTANRILFPSGTIVSRAGGYWASVLLYGTYGTHDLGALIEWEYRKRRCARLGDDSSASGGPPPFLRMGAKPEDDALRAYLDSVNEIHARAAEAGARQAIAAQDASHVLAQELEVMVSYRLGDHRSFYDLSALRVVQEDALKVKQELDQAFLRKDLGPHPYAKEVNTLVQRAMASSATVLGGERYKQVFDMEVGTSVELVDPDILASLR